MKQEQTNVHSCFLGGIYASIVPDTAKEGWILAKKAIRITTVRFFKEGIMSDVVDRQINRALG